MGLGLIVIGFGRAGPLPRIEADYANGSLPALTSLVAADRLAGWSSRGHYSVSAHGSCVAGGVSGGPGPDCAVAPAKRRLWPSFCQAVNSIRSLGHDLK